MTDDLQNTLRRIRKNELPPNKLIFDDLQMQIGEIINTTIYKLFFQSDVFFQYVEQIKRNNVAQATATANIHVASCSKASGISPDGNTNLCNNNNNSIKTEILSSPIISNLSFSNELPILHEGTELVMNERTTTIKPLTDRSMPKLTKEALLATQKGRLEVRPPG